MNAAIENNFKYHAPTDEQVKLYGQVRSAAKTLAYVLDACCPNGREKSKAMTELEDSVMWANAAIARSDGQMEKQRTPSRD